MTADPFAGLAPPYSTIVADPPWPYDNAGDQFAIPKPPDQVHTRGVGQMTYSLTSLPDLAALPVAGLAAPNAHLYVWTTNAFMVEAHTLAEAWGFTPKTVLTWVKVKRDDPATPSMKTGYWFRGATEHVVFAVRGTLRLATSEGLPTAMLWPRERHHSVKPAAFGDLVEKASPGPYLELFARAQRMGWDSWGRGHES